jgi:transglutaminase-like putative cysteine protease
VDKSPARDWDWLSAVLLFLLLQITAGRLIVTNWAPFLYSASIMVALGVSLGMALGISRFKPSMVAWLAIDYSVMLIPWEWTGVIQNAINSNYPEQILILVSRLAVALGQFIQRKAVSDTFLFVAFVTLILWLISIAAGYWLMRHENLAVAVIPSGLLMVIIQIYDNYFALRSWWLGVYLFVALLLAGRSYFIHSHAQWKLQHVSLSEDSWPDIFNGLIVIAIVSIFVAWIFPTSLSSLQSAANVWNKVSSPIRDRLSNAVVSLQSPYSNGGANFYSDSLPLGTKAAQGNQPVFSVKILSSSISKTYYWRGRVYDYYANGQWNVTSASSLDFEPANPDLNLVNAQNHSDALFQFTMQLPQQSLLYAPSEPVWMDQRGNVSITSINNAESDPLAWFAKPFIGQGGHYQVRAKIGDPTVEELKSAGTNYPAWVRNRYLEIPPSIQTQIQTLAAQLTSGASTPYDKAQAITNYLRNTIQYTTAVPPPPTDEDPAVWVLFDYKKGFCNYYASDEVLMLRSIGIPARLAVGFAQGELTNDTYTVVNHDAHAWPEVYFPNVGWVEFEPTVNQNPIARPETKALVPTPQSNIGLPRVPTKPKENLPSDSSSASKPLVDTLLIDSLWIIFSVTLVGVMIFAFRRYRLLDQAPIRLSKTFERFGAETPSWINNWITWNQLTSIERSFASINISLRMLGIKQPVSATAAERASALIKKLPAAKDYIEIAASEHQAALFTAHSTDPARARRAGLMILFHTLRFTVLKLVGRGSLQ